MTSQHFSEFTEGQKRTLEALAKIFLPFANRRRKERYPSEGTRARFVHYTTAENAIRIIETKRLWMRSTMCMSDYREVDHGHDMLERVFHSTVNGGQSRYDLLTSTIDACVPGMAASSAVEMFNKNWNQIRHNTYVASLSEHDSGQEDLYGRLSMWRAYGGVSGRVALVVSLPWLSRGTQLLKVVFSPVAYLTEDGVAKELDAVIENVRSNAEFLSSMQPREWVYGIIYTMLLSAVTCLKHDGFHEEREWRVIHGAFPLFSELMENSIECINGVAQRVFKLPLEAKISPDLEFSAVFDRLIIGPTQYPTAMHAAFASKLGDAGVADAASKVIISNIPIRT